MISFFVIGCLLPIVSCCQLERMQFDARQKLLQQDSVWVSPFLIDLKPYYIGKKNVSYKAFEAAMIDSAREVAEHIVTGRRLAISSRYIVAASLGLIAGGLAVAENENHTMNSRRRTFTSISLVGAGVVAAIIAPVVARRGRTEFERGVGLFNLKLKMNKLEPYRVKAGATNNGIGLYRTF